MKFTIIVVSIFFLAAYGATADIPLFEYQGKVWNYSDFADYQDEEFMDWFLRLKLDAYPEKEVEKFLIVTIPTRGTERAWGAETGKDIVDGFGRAFLRNFIVAQSFKKFLDDFAIEPDNIDVFEAFIEALNLSVKIRTRYNEILDLAIKNTTNYDDFLLFFKENIGIESVRLPVKELYNLHHSKSRELLKFQMRILPWKDREGNVSRWYQETSMNALMMKTFRVFIEDKREEVLSRLREEKSVYEVVLFSIDEEGRDLEAAIAETQALLEEIGRVNLSYDLVKNMPNVGKIQRGAMNGLAMKEAAGMPGFLSLWARS